MRKRATSFVLLLMLTGSTLAGRPLHSNEESCSIGGAMGDMDCCKAALMQMQASAVASARLCCAIDCSNDGTAPSGNLRISPQQRPAVSLFHTNLPTFPQAVLVVLLVNRSHGPPFDSHPAYIRSLALLI